MNSLKLAVAMVCTVSAGQALATWVGNNPVSGHRTPGLVVRIDMIPTLPAPGSEFEVQVSGTDYRRCPPDLESGNITVSVNNNDWGAAIGIRASEYVDCGSDAPPHHFSHTFSLTEEQYASIDHTKPVRVSFLRGRDFINTSSYARDFDFRYGLHSIPPRLKPGIWVGPEDNGTAMMIEQQGDTVVFYYLGYRGAAITPDAGGSSWNYAEATMQGNSGNGLAFRPILKDADFPRRPVPDDDSLFSSSIRIESVNRVWANPQATGTAGSTWETVYHPWVFRLDANALPATMPDMSGPWTLSYYDGENLEEVFALEFLAGRHVDGYRYQFDAPDGDYYLVCRADLSGVGACTLNFADDAAKYSFDLLDFNGNVALGDFTAGDEQPSKTGILLRGGYTLPQPE